MNHLLSFIDRGVSGLESGAAALPAFREIAAVRESTPSRTDELPVALSGSGLREVLILERIIEQVERIRSQLWKQAFPSL